MCAGAKLVEGAAPPSPRDNSAAGRAVLPLLSLRFALSNFPSSRCTATRDTNRVESRLSHRKQTVECCATRDTPRRRNLHRSNFKLSRFVGRGTAPCARCRAVASKHYRTCAASAFHHSLLTTHHSLDKGRNTQSTLHQRNLLKTQPHANQRAEHPGASSHPRFCTLASNLQPLAFGMRNVPVHFQFAVYANSPQRICAANSPYIPRPHAPKSAVIPLSKSLTKPRTAKSKPQLSHYDESGRVRMVDVTAKQPTTRTAIAHAFVRMQRATVASLRRLKNPKGNPLEIARIAGITAAKRTSELIPLCHPLALTHVDVRASLCQNGVEITSEATATGPTGVEMEALVGASVAALTIYDMCKALERGMQITEVHLVKKSGGRSGTYLRRDASPRKSARQ